MSSIRNVQGLGEQIRQIREAGGLSQIQLGERAQIAQQHVSLIERGLITPTMDVLCRLADALSADWCYDGRRIVLRRRPYK